MTSTSKPAARVSLNRLPNSEAGWRAAQAAFNRATQTAEEFFGQKHTGHEGRSFFQRVLADNDAQTIEVFEIILHTQVSKSVGLITLGSGYAGSDAGYIHFMFVIDEKQGMGIGAQALKRLEEYASTRLSRMTLVSALPENRTTRFWIEQGYVRSGKLNANLQESDEDAIVQRLVKPLVRQQSSGEALARVKYTVAATKDIANDRLQATSPHLPPRRAATRAHG